MKYPKIDLKTIRLQTRQFQAENPRLFLVYLLPSMLVILSGFLNPLKRINESILEQSFLSVLSHVFQAYLFPLLVSFIGTILLTSSVYTTLKLIKNPDTELTVKNSLTLFNEEHFSQTFLTLLLKRFYLFLWSIPNLFGVYLLFYSSAMARKFVELHPEFPSVDVTNPDIEHFLLTFALYFFGSVLVMILGTIIYLPQYYAYSQVELLLCDTLAIGIAKPSRVLHTSRFLMKGYKFQRFVLDLQLLPWYILIWISFGIASISIFPYIYSSQIFFYQRLLEIKRRKV